MAKVPIYLINLATATERRALVQRELAAAGLTATLVEAIDARTLTRDTLLQDCKAEGPWGFFHTKDMVCTLSHQKAWRQFFESDAKIGLFLEDDVFLSPELGDWLADLSWWPAGADIIKLERWRDDRLVVALSTAATEHLGRSVARLRSRHSGGAAYLMTRDAAHRFAESQPFSMGVDHLLFNLPASRLARQSRIYQVNPALVEQGNDVPGGIVGPPRGRPKGWAGVRQGLRRGILEVTWPLRLLPGIALSLHRLVRITYERNTRRVAAPIEGEVAT